MFCKNCGSEINGRYCAKCGYDNQISPEIQENQPTSVNIEKKRNNTVRDIIIALTFIFTCFAPIGIILMWVWGIPKSKGIRIFATILFAFIFVYAISNLGNTKSNEQGKPITTTQEPVIKITTNESSSTQGVSDNTSIENDEQTTQESIPALEDFENIESVSYKDILRYPDENAGKLIVIEAEVQQCMDGGLFDDGKYYRVLAKDEELGQYWGDEYYVFDCRVEDDFKILNEDVIKIYGEVTGAEEITRALTWTSDEVAGIKMYYYELISE